MTKQKEENQKLINALKKWQKIEDQSVKSTTEIIEKTKNPVIKTIMEIIRQDSAMHKKIQQLIINNFEKEPISLTPEELADIWEMVEKHIDLEKDTITLAEESRRNSRHFVVRYLLAYLMTDERKHDELLEQLEDVKSGIYPYA